MSKLRWIEKIIVKELYAPYIVEKDEDYYGDLISKYRMMLRLAKDAGADGIALR